MCPTKLEQHMALQLSRLEQIKAQHEASQHHIETDAPPDGILSDKGLTLASKGVALVPFSPSPSPNSTLQSNVPRDIRFQYELSPHVNNDKESSRTTLPSSSWRTLGNPMETVMKQLADEARRPLMPEADAVRALASYKPPNPEADAADYLIRLDSRVPPRSSYDAIAWDDYKPKRSTASIEDSIDDAKRSLEELMTLLEGPHMNDATHAVNITVLWNTPIDGWTGVADEAVEFVVPLTSHVRKLGIVGAL